MLISLKVDDHCGEISLSGGSSATIEVEGGYVHGGGTQHETYDGDYVSVPSWSEQIYGTKSKLMSDDFTVEKIREYEVANDAGGLTLTI